MCAQQFCEAGNWVWTVWKRYEVSGTRPEIFFAPFGRGLRVNGGWRETNFWDVCKTQHFSFCLDIHAKHSKYRNTEIQQLSLCPSSGPKCPPLKNGHLGPRSVGPQTIGPRTVGPQGPTVCPEKLISIFVSVLIFYQAFEISRL